MANCGLLLNDGSSFVLLNDGVSAILLNDNSCAFEPGGGGGQPQAPVILPSGGRGLDYLSWWERELRRILRERKKPKKKLPPRKKELLEDLEESILDLSEQLAERTETDAYAKEIRAQVLESARFMNAALEAQITNKRIQAEISLLQAYLRELDDEEAIILAIH